MAAASPGLRTCDCRASMLARSSSVASSQPSKCSTPCNTRNSSSSAMPTLHRGHSTCRIQRDHDVATSHVPSRDRPAEVIGFVRKRHDVGRRVEPHEVAVHRWIPASLVVWMLISHAPAAPSAASAWTPGMKQRHSRLPARAPPLDGEVQREVGPDCIRQLPASAARTAVESRRPSTRPSARFESRPITLPMSFGPVAPASAIPSATNASSSWSDICCGR